YFSFRESPNQLFGLFSYILVHDANNTEFDHPCVHDANNTEFDHPCVHDANNTEFDILKPYQTVNPCVVFMPEVCTLQVCSSCFHVSFELEFLFLIIGFKDSYGRNYASRVKENLL
ncbi:MAG: hypothetical protein Q8835_02460, partial [Sweet potato little leaf phytoplasma]|nr:hypothetical protein [Sweet potato little leaf phytoplasma]